MQQFLIFLIQGGISSVSSKTESLIFKATGSIVHQLFNKGTYFLDISQVYSLLRKGTPFSSK